MRDPRPQPTEHAQPIVLARVTRRQLGKLVLTFWTGRHRDTTRTFTGRAVHMRAMRYARTGEA